jgi:hypothetical protein
VKEAKDEYIILFVLFFSFISLPKKKKTPGCPNKKSHPKAALILVFIVVYS